MARFMSSFRFLCVVLLAGLVAFPVAIPATVAAQSPTLNVPSIEVRSVLVDPDDPDAALNMRVAKLFWDELKTRGIPREGPGLEVQFMARTHGTSDGTMILLSLVEGVHLSEPVLDEAAKHEVWFAGRTIPEDAEEGKFVREYVTREILEGHVQISNIVQHLVSDAELPAVVSTYLDDVSRRLGRVE